MDDLADPSWFIEFKRPPGYPSPAPANHPVPPFTIVGVQGRHEVEPLYHDFIRPLDRYREAYGLVDHDVYGPAIGDDGPTIPPIVFDVHAPHAPKQVLFQRKDHFFFMCAPTCACVCLCLCLELCLSRCV